MIIQPTREQTKQVNRTRAYSGAGFGPRSFRCFGFGMGLGFGLVSSSGGGTPSDIDFSTTGSDFWLDPRRSASYTASGSTLTSLKSLITGTALSTILGAPQIVTDPRDAQPAFFFPASGSKDSVTGNDAQYIAAVTGTNKPFFRLAVVVPGDPTFTGTIDSVRNTGNISGQEFLSSAGSWYLERDGAPSGPARTAASEGVRAGQQLICQYSLDGLTTYTSINDLTETSATMLSPGALAPNIVGIGIQTGSTNTLALYGWIKELAYWGTVPSAALRALYRAIMMRKHTYLLTAPEVDFVGDSITAAVAAGVTNGGMPALLSQRVRALGYYMNAQGPFNTGGGMFPYRHSGVSGNTCAQMNTRVISYNQGLGGFGAAAFNGGTPTPSKGYYRRCRLTCLLGGTNDIIADPTAANYGTLLDNIYAQQLTTGVSFRIAVTPIPPQPANVAAVNTYNAALATKRANFEAAHPGILINWNAFACNPALSDGVHPTDAGNVTLVDDPTNGLLQAVLPWIVSCQGQAANL